MKIKFQGQPVEILTLLLARPGEVITREEFQKKLWQAETFVDFERSLNAAMKRLRAALGESADNPVYVETLARRGYRFVAPVERVRAVMPTPQRAVSRKGSRPWIAAGGCVLATVLATGLWPIDVPQVERVVPLTNDTTLKVGIGRLISDGNRVLYGDGNDVWSVPASGGEAERLSLGFLQVHQGIGRLLAHPATIPWHRHIPANPARMSCGLPGRKARRLTRLPNYNRLAGVPLLRTPSESPSAGRTAFMSNPSRMASERGSTR